MNQLNEELKSFLEEVTDFDKKDAIFENHMDTHASNFLKNCDIKKTTEEIAKNTISSIEELKEQGFLCL